MAHKHQALAAVVLAALLIPIIATSGVAQTDTPKAAIRALERVDPVWYFDMHGNAHGDLQELMIARFEATPEITRSIDRLERTGRHGKLVEALYGVLGFVKDPASIPFLQRKLAENKTSIFYSHYLPEWHNMLDGYGTWEWLDGRERWIAFFIEVFRRSSNSARRAEILEALAGFDDETVVRFFNEQGAASLGPREVLLVEAYKQVHVGSLSDSRISQAIDTLAPRREEQQFLVETAYKLRHPAFVPFLIRIVDRRVEKYSQEALVDPQGALEKITFEMRPKGRRQWNEWFAKYGASGRQAWLRTALDSMRRLIRDDHKAALLFFEKAVYRWDDIALLPFIESDLVPRREFHDHVAGWINLTYQPAYRPLLQSLALKISANAPFLADWARNLLVERDFLPGRRRSTWAEYVAECNRKV